VLKDRDYGVNITTAISKCSSKTIGSIFVDDMDLASGKLNSRRSDLDSTIKNIQELIEWWEGCLKFTGRAIWPDKFFAYILDFQFKTNKEYFLVPAAQIEEELKVKDEFDYSQTLQLIDPSVGKEILGVMIAPDGNNTDQYQALDKKVKKWVGALKVHSLPPDKLFASISSIILKSLEYLTSALTLLEK